LPTVSTGASPTPNPDHHTLPRVCVPRCNVLDDVINSNFPFTDLGDVAPTKPSGYTFREGLELTRPGVNLTYVYDNLLGAKA
jgi:hypothetical protein